MDTFEEPSEAEETVRAYTKKEIQSEFMEYVFDIATYWVQQGSSRLETVSGFMHSFHVASTGAAGGLGTGFDIVVTPRDETFLEVLGDVDINDGSLQYYFPEKIDKTLKLYSDGQEAIAHAMADGVTDLASLMESQLRLMWHIKIYDIAKGIAMIPTLSDAGHLSPKTQIYLFVRMFFRFLDNGDKNFEKITIISSPAEEDKDWYIENGENYYPAKTSLNEAPDSLEHQWLTRDSN